MAHDEFDRWTASGPVQANRFLTFVNGAFNFGIKREEVDRNPFAPIQRHTERPRKTFIPEKLLGTFVDNILRERITGDIDAADSVITMLLTGLRYGNVREAKWSDINLDTGRWFIERTKNGTEQIVYCHPYLLRILKKRFYYKENDLIFNGRKSVRYCLNRATKELDCSVSAHTLRHTFTTAARKAIADIKIIETLTSHRSNSLTVGTYMHLEEHELRDAFYKVGNKILQLATQDKNFVELLEE